MGRRISITKHREPDYFIIQKTEFKTCSKNFTRRPIFSFGYSMSTHYLL